MDNSDDFVEEKLLSRRRLDFEDEETFKGKSAIELTHSKISNDAILKIHMEFKTEEEAYDFYNAYAYKVGFSFRRSKVHKDRDGKITSRTFCCSCEGRHEKNKRQVIAQIHRAETRFGSLVRMKISLHLFGKYRVFEFIAEHTHVTSSPSKSHLHRSQRRLTHAQIAEIDLTDISGIAPKANCELMARRVGGRENLGFIPQDYRNYLRTKRTNQMRLGDTSGILEYLQRMQLEDPTFFSAIQLDEDDRTTNIFLG